LPALGSDEHKFEKALQDPDDKTEALGNAR
jgi:hypothetical protein